MSDLATCAGQVCAFVSGDHTMRLFMWQPDLVAVAKFLDECLELLYTAGPLMMAVASCKSYCILCRLGLQT